MPLALLGLGSNIGDKVDHLNAAIDALGASDGIIITAVSRFYKTPPWGYEDQDWFVNGCLALETEKSADALLDLCLAIETELGRKRSIRWGPRIIDIDILTYGDDTIATDRLSVPHPRILERAFVLVPMQDVVPDLVLFGEALKTHLARLADRDQVQPLS